ncbi:TlpA family protein disulfide reductase [Flammeovirga kamogawensis]|uniref:TlpA family protein disulfide reductase n=1 Tax=Flammeovirga kamogawensis TaxID=373891 RepID=A0ABX8GTM1_9BACT|nr:TlpA disulfide reductase family protein [Flammeovirga kamogawensis]MBB6460009.1 thiol-disulfide isomerase/thioredoxin [Flammeovirga kamogawensis]QWG06943.1 TlpA family protein disulfide reductase [Flammeovirga kamogawensis]TRX68763.1 TlpA family protein disulfide reductase [Flammeovirga kamogawensis]
MKKKLILPLLGAIITLVFASFSFLPKADKELYTFKDLKGEKVDFKQFEGKYVYIDVWASWCGPCLREIPSLQDLEKKHHGKDVVFVSLSVDQDTEAWKKMVIKKGLEGNQFHFADNNDFVQKFNIQSIPRFILLDKKGKVKAADAPRPSSEDIEKLFEQLGI